MSKKVLIKYSDLPKHAKVLFWVRQFLYIVLIAIVLFVIVVSVVGVSFSFDNDSDDDVAYADDSISLASINTDSYISTYSELLDLYSSIPVSSSSLPSASLPSYMGAYGLDDGYTIPYGSSLLTSSSYAFFKGTSYACPVFGYSTSLITNTSWLSSSSDIMFTAILSNEGYYCLAVSVPVSVASSFTVDILLNPDYVAGVYLPCTLDSTAPVVGLQACGSCFCANINSVFNSYFYATSPFLTFNYGFGRNNNSYTVYSEFPFFAPNAFYSLSPCYDNDLYFHFSHFSSDSSSSYLISGNIFSSDEDFVTAIILPNYKWFHDWGIDSVYFSSFPLNLTYTTNSLSIYPVIRSQSLSSAPYVAYTAFSVDACDSSVLVYRFPNGLDSVPYLSCCYDYLVYNSVDFTSYEYIGTSFSIENWFYLVTSSSSYLFDVSCYSPFVEVTSSAPSGYVCSSLNSTNNPLYSSSISPSSLYLYAYSSYNSFFFNSLVNDNVGSISILNQAYDYGIGYLIPITVSCRSQNYFIPVSMGLWTNNSTGYISWSNYSRWTFSVDVNFFSSNYPVESEYSLGYSDGYSDGYSSGYNLGTLYGESESWSSPVTTMINTVGDILDVKVFGYFSLGTLVSIGIFLFLALAFLKMFSGG